MRGLTLSPWQLAPRPKVHTLSLSEAPVSKPCTDCGLGLPLESFGPPKGGRYGRRECCRSCYALRHRAIRAAKRHGRFESYCREVQNAKNSQKVIALTVVVLKSYGGIEGVAAALRDFMAKARENDPSGRAWLAGFNTLMRLFRISCALVKRES